MSVTNVLFENGVEIGPTRNSVILPNGGAKLADIYVRISEKYNVRPVLLTETVPPIGDSKHECKRHLVLNLNWHEDPLNVLVSALRLPQGIPEHVYVSLSRPMLNVQYIAGALVYHCQELALLYSNICDSAVGLRQVLPSMEKTFCFQWQSKAYYEFDALITAARRTYDTLRYILWPVFGSHGSTPSNFRKTLDLCERLPEELRRQLSKSWDTRGAKLTAYRDCIQHYVPVSYGIETALLRQVAGGTWSVVLPIPNNPEKKSQRDFQFTTDDALTYSWELTNELIGIATQVFAAIPLAGNSDAAHDND